jgi:hypothetical protein
MLTIRQEQLNELQLAQRTRFHRELMALFRKEIPNEVARYDDAALLEQIAIGHEKACGYKIESERGVARFVGLRLITAPPFDEHPGARTYLERNDIDGTQKMDLIFQDLMIHFELS